MVDYVFERHLSGGILLPANKLSSTSLPIRRGFVPTQVVLALLQHRGNPAEPVVQVGDYVAKGQTVATAGSAPSAAVHASCSGESSKLMRDILFRLRQRQARLDR